MALLLAVTAALATALPRLELGKQKTSWFSKDDASLAEYKRHKRRFHIGEGLIAAFLVDGGVQKKHLVAMNRFADRVQALDYVERVVSVGDRFRGDGESALASMSEAEALAAASAYADKVPFGRYLINEEADTVGFLVDLWIPPEDRVEDVAITSAIIEKTRALQKEAASALGRPLLVGDVVVDSDIGLSIGRDIAIMLPLAAVVAILVLFFFLRQGTVFVWPLLAVVSALICTLGLKALFGSPFTVVSTSLFAVILIIGVSDSIHIIQRYAFLCQDGAADAGLETMKSMAPACFFTSLTTALGFLSLVTSPVPMVRDLGIFAASGIMLSYLFVIPLCPISFRYARAGSAANVSVLNRALTALGDRVLGRPVPVIAGFALFTVAVLSWGGTQMGLDGRLINYFKKSSSIRADTVLVEERLGGIGFGEVIIEGKPGAFLSKENVSRLEAACAALAASPYIDHVVSGADMFRIADSGRAASAGPRSPFDIVTEDKLLGLNSFQNFFTRDFSVARVSYAESSVAPAEKRLPLSEMARLLEEALPAFDIRFTGYGTLAELANENVVGTLMRSLLGSFATVSFLLIILFGLKGGLLSLLPNWGAVAVLPGLMGLMSYKLNIGTAIIAAVTIGIVVDDTIHMFWAFREQVRRQGDVKEALGRTILNVGRPMIITSFMFVLGLNVFVFSELAILRDFGLLSSLIVVFALIFDMFFASALIRRFRPFVGRGSFGK
jgi:predicted RND superfamily exporter protein